MRLHRTLENGLARLETLAALAAGVCLLAAMVLVSADAAMRYLFASPLTFQFYFTENYLLVALILLALPWGYRTGGFIRIGALSEALPLGLRAALLRGGLVLSATYVAALGWLGGGKFLDTWRSGEVSMGVVDWPVSWSWICVPVGCGLLTLRLLLDAAAPKLREGGELE